MTDHENKKPTGPDFVAYNVREGKGDKDYWDRVGVGFMHRDGKGVDIRLNSIPTDGHVTLRERAQDFKNKQEDKAPEQARTRSHLQDI